MSEIINSPFFSNCVQNSAFQVVSEGSLKAVGRPLFTMADKNAPYEARKYSAMIGDNNQETAYLHYEIIKNITKNIIMWGGQYFAYFLPVSGGWIFWDKKTGTSDF